MTIPVAIDRRDVMSAYYAYSIPASSGGAFSTIYIVVIAATSDISGLVMNAALIPSSAFTAVGASSFSMARIKISAGSGYIYHNQGMTFSAYWFGYFSIILLGNVEGASSILPGLDYSTVFSNSTVVCSAGASQTTARAQVTTGVVTTTATPNSKKFATTKVATTSNKGVTITTKYAGEPVMDRY